MGNLTDFNDYNLIVIPQKKANKNLLSYWLLIVKKRFIDPVLYSLCLRDCPDVNLDSG